MAARVRCSDQVWDNFPAARGACFDVRVTVRRFDRCNRRGRYNAKERRTACWQTLTALQSPLLAKLLAHLLAERRQVVAGGDADAQQRKPGGGQGFVDQPVAFLPLRRIV